MENALQSLAWSTRNTPACRWQHLFASCGAFLQRCFGKMTLPKPISKSTVTAFALLWCQTLREGDDFCDRVWEIGRFCAWRPLSPLPMENYPFSIYSLYTMAATPLVLKIVLDIWTKWQIRKRQLKCCMGNFTLFWLISKWQKCKKNKKITGRNYSGCYSSL